MLRMRARTVMSLLSVALAMAVVATVAFVQLRGPEAVRASDTLSPASAGDAGAFLAPNTFRDIARAASPGVVNIYTEKIVRRTALPDAFRQWFGDDFPAPRGDKQKQTSLGSGFVIDKDGYVLTNRHVVDGADEIRVSLPNRRTYDARLIGKDARTDVALIKIDTRDPLTVLPLGDSDQADVGEWVMAIGSPFEMRGTVTVGVISYKGRPMRLQEATSIEMIQTDAAINPGNSGGPLLNTRGQVIGINTLILTRGSAQSAGVGFAVPINAARTILPQLREKGSVTRGWMGVSVGDLNDDLATSYGLKDAKGAVVSDVTSGSPAEKAGLKPEDVILGVDDKPLNDSSDLVEYVSGRAPGSSVRLRVWRAKQEKTFTATLGTFPEESESATARQPDRQTRLGMKMQQLSPELAAQLELPRQTRGIVVMEVEPGSAADDAGLRQGDLILSINGQALESLAPLEDALTQARGSRMARVRVRRGGSVFLAVIKLE
jgi:serine protease Do